MKKIYSSRSIFGLLLLCFPLLAAAQIGRDIDPITCFSHESAAVGHVPVAAAVAAGASLQLTEFIFNFDEEVPANVRAVVDYAGLIWSSKLVSQVPIRVDVGWEPVEEERVLASAGPTAIYRDFAGAIDRFVWYPVPLAEAISATNLNGEDSDISISINPEANWYFQLDGNTPPNRIDMLSVIVHELGHGLGFFSSADVESDTLGVIGFDEIPMIFDLYLVNNERLKLAEVGNFSNPSAALLRALINNELFFGSELAAQFYGEFPPLYAPNPFELGSSISHLDERAFPPGSEDALMSPFIAFGESVHDVGNVTLAIMTELGWNGQFTTTPADEPAPDLLVKLYPNPATDYLQVELPLASYNARAELQIIDVTGKLRVQQLLSESVSQPYRLAIEDLENGTYLVRLRDGRKYEATKTLVVQR